MKDSVFDLGKVLEEKEQDKIQGGYHDDGTNGGCFPEEIKIIIAI